MTNSIVDITHDADFIMLVGSNPEEAHPIIGMQLREAVAHGTRLVVVDPRRIGLCAQADIHLRIRPGTNVAFANGVLHILVAEGLVDEEFIATRTEGFEDARALVSSYTPARVADICGIDERDLRAVALMYGGAKNAAIVYCLGVTEHSHGTEGVMALANLALATGNIGRPGTGINPLRGQNNVQGACDMGASPDVFSGYQKITDASARAKFEAAWKTPLPETPGIKATECFEAMQEGRIRGLFISGEDPLRTDADTAHVMKSLQSLDFLVVCDLFLTETARLADVVLPAVAYAEKEGTFTNTERRVQRVRQAVCPPDGARPDTEIFAEIMRRMGYEQPDCTPAEIFDEMAALTPLYAGISHARLDSAELFGRGLQWPCPTSKHPGTSLLHGGEFSRGKALFCASEYRASAELPDAQFPFVLMTGRVLSHYNACAMTGRTPGVDALEGESFIEINTHDALSSSIENGQMVNVTSRRGSVCVRARVSEKTAPGQTWMPLHFLCGGCNWLTNAALDPIAKAPEYKVCAVRVEAAGV